MRDNAKEYIKSMFAKQNKGCKHDADSSDSDSEDESWRRGMNNAEQMHVLASAGISPSDSDIEIDDDNLRHYRKQAKKYFQKNKKQ